MKKLTLLALVLAASCGGDNGTSPDAQRAPDANTVDSGPPAAPALGTQIDRIGRPAINTALNNTFNPDNTSKQAAKDAYNASSDPSTWGTSFAPTFAAGLALLDGLDNNCGNQLGFDATTHYATLAGALADDELYVNSTPDLDGNNHAECNAYLAVEANALQVLPNNDCGGRVMSYDVIDTSFSTLIAGVLSGVGDNINAEASPADPDTFPFLAAPL